jgi:multicomponent Na+:H+ antiporter subunit D
VIFIPALALMAGALAVGLIPGVVPAFEGAAEQFTNGGGYAHAVLAGGAGPGVASGAAYSAPTHAYLYAVLTLALSVLLAALAVFRRSSPLRAVDRLAARGLAPLHAVHSGHIGDYVAWLVLGAAGLGGACALALL